MIFVQIDVTSIFMIFTMYLSSFISTFLTLRLAEISLFHKVSSINYEIADKGGGVAPQKITAIHGEISSDLYRASLCDIKKSKVKPFELERNQ